jgi:hypothetical protein
MKSVYILVLLTGVHSGDSAAPTERLYDKENCEAVGQRWVEAATAARVHRPRYVCVLNHSR